MKDKTKIIIIYIMTFILILSNVPLFNGTTIIEMILRNFGVTNFQSNGETGFYYPTIAMLIAGLFFWLFLRKSVKNNKFSKDYFYYCFGMMLIITVVKNWIE